MASEGVQDSPTAAAKAVAFFRRLFDTDDFPARWECGNWPAELGWLHICSDIAIFVAYAAIPTVLMFFVFRRRDVALRGIVWLFVAFILFCGLTHLTDAIMFYLPAYRFLGVMKLSTAVVSWATVLALIGVLPTALSLPGIAEAHRLAQREIERRKESEETLIRARDELEKRGAQLTARAHRLQNAMLGIQTAAVAWAVESGEILWEAGLGQRIGIDSPSDGHVNSWKQILGEPEVERLRRAAESALGRGEMLYIKLPIVQSDGSIVTLVLRSVAERTDPSKSTMTGMCAFVQGVEG